MLNNLKQYTPASVKPQQPIDRVFAILTTIVRARKPIGIADIASTLSIPGPTVHRVVASLEERGYLRRVMGSKKLLPGARLLEFSNEVIESVVLTGQSHAVLEELARTVQEHCQIGTITRGEVLYIDAVQVRRTHGLQLEQGRTAPLHCTSIGKLYLASLDKDALAAWLNQRTLEKNTENTITSHGALLSDLEEIRRTKVGMSNEEYGAGVVGCAVRIPTRLRNQFLAIGISVPAARTPFSNMSDFIEPLRQAAHKIGKIMIEEV